MAERKQGRVRQSKTPQATDNGMLRRGAVCQVCENVDRASIELGIANKVPSRVLARRYGVHADAVLRHARNHMTAELKSQLVMRGRMTPAEIENLRAVEGEAVLQHLVVLRGRLYEWSDLAEQDGDYKAAAAIGDKVIRVCEVIAKMLGELSTGTVTVNQNFLVMPEFHALRTAIMQALREHPEAREGVVAALRNFQAAELPPVESAEERRAAEPTLAKARATMRSRRAIEGEARRVGTGE